MLALPRRPRPTDEALERLRVELEATLSLPNSLCECVSKYHRICCNHLLPVQTWALSEAREVQGILGPIGVGHGKALALDTPIPTPSGWSTMGDLQVGDIVFDSAGRPCRVTHITEIQHDRECFDVRFSDGSVITADADHRWLTRSYLERRSLDRGTKSHAHEPQVRTTLEIRDTLKHRHSLNHAVDAAGTLHTNHMALPLDPYVLGAWLGDGSSVDGEITSADPEVLQRFDEHFARGHASSSGAASTQYYKGLRVALRDLGVLGNKHVPAAYLRASASQRLELLRGLMDTDGHAASDNTVEFCNTNESLALAVFELAASLGQVPKIYNGRATLYGRDCGPKYRVCWQPTIDVFSLRRKSERLRLGRYKQSQIKSRRYVEAVTPRPSVPVKCITVDSPDHSYLCGKAMITTHNTLLDLLTPMVVPCRVAVLLLPSKLKKQLLESDWHFYGQHWKLPNLAGSRWQHPGRPILHVVAFEELSGAKSTDLLEKLTPDLLICDEAHRLADSSAARTKRWLRYVRHNPSVKVFCWSGTLTKRSLKNWAHLSNAALKQGSPAPRDFPTLEAWAGATDPGEFPTPAGDLMKLCAPGETAFEGFGRRVVDTPGVISSGDAQACEASLIISQRPLTAPKVVVDALEKVAKLWERPDGETLIDPLSVARCMREVSCGFYYFWKWPRGEAKEVREKWLEARKEWRSEIRERLKRSAPHLDSPMLLARAAQRWHKGFVYLDEEGNRHTVPPYTHSTIEKHPTWESATWERWHELRDSAHPVTDAFWLDDFMIEDVLAWLSEGPGLAWYEHDAMARRIMERADGIVHCGPGDEGSSKLLKLRGTERVLLTIKSHGEGKNLQMFNRSLVANPPSGGAEWEQLLGRTHRTGQMQDEVLFDVYRHTQTFRDALDKARDLSGYIQGSFGNTQKLVAKATWRFSA